MKNFRPNFPFSTAILLLIPTYTNLKGVTKKEFDEKNGILLKCSFKTYGGTETINNNIYTIIDTANIETWFRPDIKSDCRIKVLETEKIYEIFGTIENIDMRNQFVKFKVRALEGGA